MKLYRPVVVVVGVLDLVVDTDVPETKGMNEDMVLIRSKENTQK
jgi:hypothetical protein